MDPLAQAREFVSAARIAGKTDLQIKQDLTARGWTADQLTPLFSSPPSPSSVIIKPKPTNIFLWGMIILFAVVSLAGGGDYIL